MIKKRLITSKNRDLSDEELMKEFTSQNSTEAFEIIYHKYFVQVTKYLFWITQDLDQSKDIAQNIFIKIYDKPNLFDPEKNFKIWLFTIAKNNGKNYLRDQSIKKKHLKSIVKEVKSADNTMEEYIPDNNAEFIKKQIHLLSDIHKEVLLLKYSSNLTVSEISEILGCSVGTIKSRLFYAIKNLKKIIST